MRAVAVGAVGLLAGGCLPSPESLVCLVRVQVLADLYVGLTDWPYGSI